MADLPEPVATQIPPELVIRELETILSSEIFVNSNRLSGFLRYVVEHTLEGNTTGLKEYLIGLDVFSRTGSYDTRADPVVRVEARQLRFKLADYYAGPGRDDEIVISLPKGGYVARFERHPVGAAAVEAPAAPVIVEAVQAQRPQGRQSPNWLLRSGVLVAGAAAVLYVILALRPAPESSIAVLPFANLSADPANQYFSDGLTDEITDALSRLKTLRVIARASAFQFKGKIGDLREVGRQLNVGTVLEGSVERYGDRVRIVAQLERVSDGSHIWSSTYERQAADLFSVQSELAAGIAASLKTSMSVGNPKKHIPSAEAHDFYMRGNYELEQVTPESLSRAEESFQHAIERDPDYAAAFIGLGTAKFNRAIARLTDSTNEELKSSEQLWRKAIQLDPEIAAAHANLALLAMQLDWDWGRAERELHAALATGPNSSAESTYAILLTDRGRFSEADDHLRRAQDLDPLGVVQLTRSCGIRFSEGRFAQAREECQKIVARYPRNLQAAIMANAMYVAEGRPELALPAFQRMEKEYPPVRVYEAMAKARLGQRKEALDLIRPFEEQYRNSAIPRQWFALVYGVLGDEKNALLWLERSADEREFQALNFAVNPVFARMQDNAGFKALKKRMGLDR
jgi:TolB-like protein/tetratricopeptide (TPR) repeat protein